MLTLYGLIATIGAIGMTVLGGLLAFRFRARLPRVAAFGAGSLIAVALLDLLPAALDERQLASSTVTTIAGGAFLLLYVLERFALFHAHGEEEAPAGHALLGALGAAGVSLQSMLDGAALGFAFGASERAGIAVAVAVMLHKLTDGTSTVGLILTSGNPPRQAVAWLALASAAPLIGFLLSAAIVVPPAGLAGLLAFFAGTFLYLGASHLLPEAHHADPGRAVAAATVGGFAFVALIGQLLGRV